MNAIVTEKLNKLFGQMEFVESIKKLDSFDPIYEAVTSKDESITREELQEYLEMLSSKMNNDELSESDLSSVAGGGGFGIGAAIGIISGCYKLGEGLGKFIYNITHR